MHIDGNIFIYITSLEEKSIHSSIFLFYFVNVNLHFFMHQSNSTNNLLHCRNRSNLRKVYQHHYGEETAISFRAI